jgi:hypothetical protein
VQTKNTKCVLKEILIEVSGHKVLETCLFNIFDTCWTAPILTSHPFSDRRALLILPDVMYVCENLALALGRTKIGVV